MQKPLVSVIVPVYNVEEYLEECFLSIKNQTYENIEIILVDDGSTDGSGKIADSLAKMDKRATVIHKKNGGLSDARNVGMKKAQGEYITFVDSDDYIADEFVATMIEAAVEESADIVQADNSRKSEDLGKGTMRSQALSGADAFSELMRYKTISPTAWGKLYKKSLFTGSAIEFPVGRIHEDTAVLYKLVFLAQRVVCLDQTLYYYRYNGASIMTTTYTQAHYESVIQYIEELENFIKLHAPSMSSKVISKHVALRLLSVLNRLAASGQSSEPVYKEIRLHFLMAASQSRDMVCLICTVPAHMPFIFSAASFAVPTLRKLMGKV